MAILMPRDTREALGPDASECKSRSLCFDRFADPQAKEDARNKWFKGIAALKPSLVKCEAWSNWLANSRLGLKPGESIFAQLQSRLMVNMAGGVMENAGLCLDRFGVPYIPGTAVKGCARHLAIQSLLEAREAKEPTDKLARLLADIALVFGWGEQDWKTRQDIVSKLRPKRDDTDEVFAHRCQESWKAKRSDFAYAVGDQLWEEVAIAARRLLPNTDHFAGTVSFLPAYPHHLPANDLELDIVTCHHPKYYLGDPAMPVALDIEEPNPVVFLTVAAGIVFQFAALPIRRAETSLVGQVSDLTVPGVSDSVNTPTAPGNPGTSNEPESAGSEPPPTGRPEVCPTAARLLTRAREWLREGLETFGLGAKTAAGYGWFDASEDFNQRFLAEQRAKAQAEAERLKAEQAVSEAKTKERADKEEKERQRGRLTPDDAWVAQFKSFPEIKRREVINKFAFEEEKWWPTQGELADERIQFSLLHFLVKVEPEFLAADRANPKSKTAKALAGLKRKFPAMTPSS
jgi:CRISPR type III-B/RAMP module RAMP protein Cmr6